MDERHLSTIRDSERAEEIRRLLVLLTDRIVVPCYLLSWGIDLLFVPAMKWELLTLRLLVVPVSMAVTFKLRRDRTLESLEWTSAWFSLCHSLLISIITFAAKGQAPLYYSALNLLAIAILGFLPWKKRWLYPLLGLLYGPFMLCAAITFFTQNRWVLGALPLQVFFIGATIAISILVHNEKEKLRSAEILARFSLLEEIASRNRVIAQKTSEAIRLSELSKQFSPQVVENIISGKLALTYSTERRKICAAFVDIVNSTDRIVRIDEENVNRVISMFMENAIHTFLRYDVTIDKFLGDGVLVFTNHPIASSDYIARLVNACLALRDLIRERQDEYLSHWLDTFQIRIGIATGHADVGFYGVEQKFRTYTAIGRVVNLASRLCSSATPDAIYASHDVVKALPEGTIHTSYLGPSRLKGFDADLIKVYEIGPRAKRELRSA